MTGNIIQLSLNVVEFKLLTNQSLLNFFLLTLGFCFLLGQKFCINFFKIVYFFLQKTFNLFLLVIEVLKFIVNPFNIGNFITLLSKHFCFKQTFLGNFFLQVLVAFLNSIFIGLDLFDFRFQLLLFSCNNCETFLAFFLFSLPISTSKIS